MTAANMTEEHLSHLLADHTIHPVHRALWSLLWDGEVRLTEALSLDVRDVDLQARTMRVDYRAKPGPETAPISERTASLLREAIGEQTEGPALHVNGRPLSRDAAALRARTVGLSVHGFRSSGPARERLADA